MGIIRIVGEQGCLGKMSNSHETKLQSSPAVMRMIPDHQIGEVRYARFEEGFTGFDRHSSDETLGVGEPVDEGDRRGVSSLGWKC